MFQNIVLAGIFRRLLLLLNQNFLLYWNVQLVARRYILFLIVYRYQVLILVQGTQVIVRFTIQK
jgi:hypothetical protein